MEEDIDNKEEVKQSKKRKPSRFASRMAKKRSNLDRKLSKMKSRFRDVESRKEAALSDKASEPEESQTSKQNKGETDLDTKAPPSDDDFSQKNKQDNTKSNKEAKTPQQGKTVEEQLGASLNKKEERVETKAKDNVAKTEGGGKENTATKEAIISGAKTSKERKGASNPLKAADKEKKNKRSKRLAKDQNAKKLSEQQVSLDPSKKVKPASPAAPPISNSKAKPRNIGLTGAASLGARGGKSIKPAVLLRKIIDRLDDSSDLRFVSSYRNEFLSLLKNLHQHRISIAWYVDSYPGKLKDAKSAVCLFNQAVEGESLTNKCETRALSDFIKSDAIESVYVSNWESLLQLAPVTSGEIRQNVDIHIVQQLPDSGAEHKVLALLERLSRNSGSLIVVPAQLKEALERLQKQYEINRGYTVVDGDRITYIDSDLSQQGINWLDELFQDELSTETVTEFCIHRKIMQSAQALELACDNEIAKLGLIERLQNPISGADKASFSVTELDALMKSTLTKTKLLLGAKGIQIDDLGQIRFAADLNESETAQGLVAELSIEDMVREDELDVLKFGAEQRKSVNRIKRFRFASKLGFLWKLKPEYIEHLHQATTDVLMNHARELYKQTSKIVGNHLKQMSGQAGALQKSSAELKAFKRFVSSWKSDTHLTDAVAKYGGLNHFRSSIFSKRGNAAPIEAQGGVLKELRESRMFVSQLMAFGMLGAVLLGSTYAIDVFVIWLSGEAIDLGDALIQAAKSSRGLGRQVRILIAGVAGICIVFYLLLRIYLRSSEKVLDQQRIADVYSQQLEEVVAKFITESSGLTKEIISADLDRLQLNYEQFRSALPDNLKESGRRIDQDSMKSTATLTKSGPIGRIEELKKWLSSVLSERDSFSIIQSQKTASGEAQQSLNG